MPEGKVKWFNENKGYGFVEPDDGGPDVFLHITTWQKAGFSTPPNEGEDLTFEVGTGRNGKPQITTVAPG